MKKIFIAVLALLMFSSSYSQGVSIKTSNDGIFRYQNTVALEVGGHGLAYSVNYERNFINTKRFKSSFQAGLSLYPAAADLVSNVWVPVLVNQLVSFNNHHIETGFGIVFTQKNNYGYSAEHNYEAYFHPYIAAKVGYRYQKPTGRMSYKLLFTPLWEKDYGQVVFHPLGAFSIGYNF